MQEKTPEETENSSEEEVTGNLLFSIDVPDNYIRKGIDKLHVVLYDGNDNVIGYKTHESGMEELLSFYSELVFDEGTNFSLAFIGNFRDEVFSIRIYKDLTISMIGEVLKLPLKPTGNETRFVDVPIASQEDWHDVIASGRGYSMVGINGRFSGHFSSNFGNNLGLTKAFVIYYNVDNIFDYSYLSLDTQELQNLNTLDVTTFSNTDVRSGSVRIDLPFENAYLQISGYEDEARFKAESGHRICFNPALLDYNGIYYSYADIFPYLRYFVQFKNYEIAGVGPPPEELPVPQEAIYYSYNNGVITYEGLDTYETARFYLQKSGPIHVTTHIISNGRNTLVTIPELPSDLFSATVTQALKVANLSMVQGAAENYQGFENYSEYITNTLGKGEPYYIRATQRERIWKSSVSTSLLPF
jgi:hypothetical protein